jgi:hypothetical protein
MSPRKTIKSHFTSYWLTLQMLGAAIIAICCQGIATIAIGYYQIDNFYLICLACGGSYLISHIIQGYGQWRILTKVVDKLDSQWMYTHTIGIPIHIIILVLVHIGLAIGTWDESGTIMTLLAGIGALGGAVSGFVIGGKQQSLLTKHLPEKSLWQDWHHDRMLAGALGGMSSAIITVGLLLIVGWNQVAAIVYIPLLFASLFITNQILYGVVIGDALTDLFKQTKLLK